MKLRTLEGQKQCIYSCLCFIDVGRALPEESQPIIFRMAPTLCGDQSSLILTFYSCVFVRIDSECLILFLIEFQSCLLWNTTAQRADRNIKVILQALFANADILILWRCLNGQTPWQQRCSRHNFILIYIVIPAGHLFFSLSRTSDKITSPCYQFTRFPAEVWKLWNWKCSCCLGTRFSQE